MIRLRMACSAGLTAALTAISACGSSAAAPPTPVASPPSFDVQLVSSVPAAGGTLDLASPNDTPVSLTVNFSVTVPPAQAGTYYWITAVRAGQPPGTGFVVPVVTTRPFESVTLAAGTQNVSTPMFHTTNAICYTPLNPPMSTSLDIEIKTLVGATPFFGKRFPVTFVLRCR